MTQEHVFQLADGVTFEAVDDGAVILVFGNGQLYSCNETSAAFLSALDGSRNLAQVAGILADEFEVSIDELLEDLGALAVEMQAEGIIAKVS